MIMEIADQPYQMKLGNSQTAKKSVKKEQTDRQASIVCGKLEFNNI